MAVTLEDIAIRRAATNSHRGLRFKITPRDIENGQPNDPCACAAALALRRTLGADEVLVYRDVTYARKKNEAVRYKTSAQLRLETIVFDREGNFFPGEYELGPGPISKPPKAKRSGSAPARRNSKTGGYRAIPNVRPTASQRLES